MLFYSVQPENKQKMDKREKLIMSAFMQKGKKSKGKNICGCNHLRHLHILRVVVPFIFINIHNSLNVIVVIRVEMISSVVWPFSLNHRRTFSDTFIEQSGSLYFCNLFRVESSSIQWKINVKCWILFDVKYISCRCSVRAG